MKTHLLLFYFFSCTILPICAQYPVPLTDKPGTSNYGRLDDENTKMYCNHFGMTTGEIDLFKKKLDKLAALLLLNPVMNKPLGVDVAGESRPYYPHGFKNNPENYGYIGEINFRLPQWFESKGRVYKQNIEPPRVTIYVNYISLLQYSAFNLAGPEGPDIKIAEQKVAEICKPMKIKELAPGVVLYDASIVITNPGKSLYLPCSVAEAYKRLFAFYELVAKKEPAWQIMLDGVKKEYATLNASQLKGPAYFGGMFSGITPVKNNDPLYLFNTDFFDRSLPKTAIQLIIFPIDADYFRKDSDFAPNSVGFKRINQFQHSLDVEALSKLIEQN